MNNEEWTTTKPTEPGIYKVRGFDGRKTEAVINVDFDEGDFVCNLHESSSLPVDEYGYLVEELDPSFEWLGPFVLAQRAKGE